jgi:molybdenum-dependent DNA-binding transcriptional regulator ModE
MLNLHLVRIFTAVATQGSFTGAAEALHISQSAVSRAVRELERQVGMALVERHSRGVILTEAGKRLVLHARRIFALERLAELSLEELQTLQTGHLAIGDSTTIGIYMLPACCLASIIVAIPASNCFSTLAIHNRSSGMCWIIAWMWHTLKDRLSRAISYSHRGAKMNWSLLHLPTIRWRNDLH